MLTTGLLVAAMVVGSEEPSAHLPLGAALSPYATGVGPRRMQEMGPRRMQEMGPRRTRERAPQPSIQEDSLRAELRLGVRELHSGDTEAARRRFERCSRDWPARAEGFLFAAYALWLDVEDDPLNPDLRREYSSLLDEAEARATPSCSKTREDFDSCLALGLLYGARARLHLLDGERLKAASDARQAKRVLSRARSLEPDSPELQATGVGPRRGEGNDAPRQEGVDPNASFGLGMYDYYASQIPRLARIIGFVLFLPGGNRQEGLRELEAARGADLMGPEALLQLHEIYKFYEKDYERALASIVALVEDFPDNPRHRLRKATLLGHFMGKPDEAIAALDLVIERASRGERYFTESDAGWAQYLAATVRFRRGERDRAILELRSLSRTARPSEPLFAPSVLTTLALYTQLSGKADEALYRDAARAARKREVLEYLDVGLRTVLPPDGVKLLRKFSNSFLKYL